MASPWSTINFPWTNMAMHSEVSIFWDYMSDRPFPISIEPQFSDAYIHILSVQMNYRNLKEQLQKA